MGSWLCHKASLHERSPGQTACPTVNMTAVAGPAKHSLLECGVFNQKTNAIFCTVCFYSLARGGIWVCETSEWPCLSIWICVDVKYTCLKHIFHCFHTVYMYMYTCAHRNSCQNQSDVQKTAFASFFSLDCMCIRVLTVLLTRRRIHSICACICVCVCAAEGRVWPPMMILGPQSNTAWISSKTKHIWTPLCFSVSNQLMVQPWKHKQLTNAQ